MWGILTFLVAFLIQSFLLWDGLRQSTKDNNTATHYLTASVDGLAGEVKALTAKLAIKDSTDIEQTMLIKRLDERITRIEVTDDRSHMRSGR